MILFQRYLTIVILVMIISACSNEQSQAEQTVNPPEMTQAAEETNDRVPEEAVSEEVLPEEEGPAYAHQGDDAALRIFEPNFGDLPQMLERRVIRALVPWSDTYFYLDGANQKGIAYEGLKGFEKWIVKEFDYGTVQPHITILPVSRDEMLEFLVQGRGDIAVGGITITDQRMESVDFSIPSTKPFTELLIESSDAETLSGTEDLGGKEIHIRRSSSYWQSLEALNLQLEADGKQQAQLVAVDEHLSTEDLMQMANAGAISYTIADSTLAEYWSQVLPDIRVRNDIVLREGARMGWAFRKDSPELAAAVNQFLSENREGTLTGNIILNRYLKDDSRLGNIHGEEEQQRLLEVIEFFQKYSGEYNFDALMMVAQGFQESRLDQSRRSHRGAVGIMQLLPSTASEPAVAVDDITVAENNILAGIRYMAWIRDTYFDDPDMTDFNKTAMAFASYNAGPSRIRRLRSKAEARGLDPDVWFDNVELIAAEDIGRETVDYVANIFIYYMAFKLSQDRVEAKSTIN